MSPNLLFISIVGILVSVTYFTLFNSSNFTLFNRILCSKKDIIYDETKQTETHKLSQIVLPFVMKDYNKDISTELNYKSSENKNYLSKYANIRNSDKIDMKYHSYYTKKRIKLQDEIIDLFIHRLNCKTKQKHMNNVNDHWIIFSGGSIGVGKTYVMNKLSSNNIIPELHYNNSIIINADIIRPLLPEYKLYDNIDDNNKFVLLARKEIGFICELLLWTSLSIQVNNFNNNKYQNIVFDSSLRHTDWFKWVFNQIMIEYKDYYKIAIIGVISQNIDQIKQQIEKRNTLARRQTDWNFVKTTINDIHKSLFVLKRFVNVSINITNPGIPFDNINNRKLFKIDIFCSTSEEQISTNFEKIDESTNLLKSCDK